MCILYKVIVRKIKDQDAEDPYKQRGLMTKNTLTKQPYNLSKPKMPQDLDLKWAAKERANTNSLK